MTTLTTLMDQLTEAAAKATPGPWVKAPIFKSEWPAAFNQVANVRGVLLHGPYASVSCGNEAEYILLANPTNILRLVSALREARDELLGLVRLARSESVLREALQGQCVEDGCPYNDIAREALAQSAKLRGEKS